MSAAENLLGNSLAESSSPADAPGKDSAQTSDAQAALGDALGGTPSDQSTQPGVPAAKTQTDQQKSDAKPDQEKAPLYQPFTLPEGLAIDPKHQAALVEYGQKYGLPQEAVQQVVSLGAEVAEMTRQNIEAESEREVQETREGWRKALLADPELGGENLKKTQSNLNAFQRSKLADAPLLDLLTSTGLITNPNIARLLSRIGASLQESPLHFGNEETARGDRNAPKELYAKSAHN